MACGQRIQNCVLRKVKTLFDPPLNKAYFLIITQCDVVKSVRFQRSASINTVLIRSMFRYAMEKVVA